MKSILLFSSLFCGAAIASQLIPSNPPAAAGGDYCYSDLSGTVVGAWVFADETTLHTNSTCTSAVSTDGDNVCCVEDVSGNGNDLADNISGSCPTWNETDDTIIFNADGEGLSFDGLASSARNVEVFIVVSPETGTTSNSNIFVICDNDLDCDTNDTHDMEANFTAPTTFSFIYGNNFLFQQYSSSYTLGTTYLLQVSGVDDGSNTDWTVTRDGSSDSELSNGNRFGGGSNDLDEIQLGDSDNSNAARMEVHEMVWVVGSGVSSASSVTDYETCVDTEYSISGL